MKCTDATFKLHHFRKYYSNVLKQQEHLHQKVQQSFSGTSVSMVRSENFQEIDILNYGETTENFEIRLPQSSDDNPISFGDYTLSHMHNLERN